PEEAVVDVERGFLIETGEDARQPGPDPEESRDAPDVVRREDAADRGLVEDGRAQRPTAHPHGAETEAERQEMQRGGDGGEHEASPCESSASTIPWRRRRSFSTTL